jgi:signal transduction histidine kinase
MTRRPTWRALTIRARITIAAVTVVAAALAAAAYPITVLEERSLVEAVDDGVRAHSADVAAEVAGGHLPPELAVSAEHETLVQVLGPSGRVVAASTNLVGEPAITDLPSVGRAVHTVPVHVGALSGESFRLSVVEADGPDGRFVVVVGASTTSVDESVGDLIEILVSGFPVLTVVLGLVIWVVVGRALRPVEAIRREVAVIGGGAPGRRITEPPASDEVSRLASTMTEMLGRLDEASRKQRQFVADASHELRSPLAGIRNQLEVDLAYPDQADWKATETEVLDETRRMERLVDDLLLLAKGDAQVVEGEVRPVDLDDVVLREAARLRARGRVEVDTRRVSGGQVVGDRDQLQRVVRNLVENAERHAERTVSFVVGTFDGEVECVVEDDGAGIPAAERDRIFERFARLDGARARHAGGAGLGLAIAREIVARHGGTLAVDDLAAGARFVVRLPASGA